MAMFSLALSMQLMTQLANAQRGGGDGDGGRGQSGMRNDRGGRGDDDGDRRGGGRYDDRDGDRDGRKGGKDMDQRDLVKACVITSLVTLAIFGIIFFFFYRHQSKKLQEIEDKRDGVTVGRPIGQESQDNIEMNQYATRPSEMIPSHAPAPINAPVNPLDKQNDGDFL